MKQMHQCGVSEMNWVVIEYLHPSHTCRQRNAEKRAQRGRREDREDTGSSLECSEGLVVVCHHQHAHVFNHTLGRVMLQRHAQHAQCYRLLRVRRSATLTRCGIGLAALSEFVENLLHNRDRSTEDGLVPHVGANLP